MTFKSVLKKLLAVVFHFEWESLRPSPFVNQVVWAFHTAVVTAGTLRQGGEQTH